MVSASMRTSPMHHWHGGPSMSLSPYVVSKPWLRRQSTLWYHPKQRVRFNMAHCKPLCTINSTTGVHTFNPWRHKETLVSVLAKFKDHLASSQRPNRLLKPLRTFQQTESLPVPHLPVYCYPLVRSCWFFQSNNLLPLHPRQNLIERMC